MSSFVSKIIVIISICLVIYVGFVPVWHHTLQGDPKYYYSLADYFFKNHQLIGFKDPIAYPPGANTFFLAMGMIFFFFPNFSAYELAIVAANIICMLSLLKIYRGNYLIFSLIALCMGPLAIFRFDLLVVLFTALAIKYFQTEKLFLTGLFLGLATMTKIFPVIILPYLLLTLFINKKSLKPVLKLGLYFALTILFFLITYMLVFNDPPTSIVAMINYNFSKSVHIESPLGSILTGIAMVQHPNLHQIDFINGLFVLTPAYLLGHARIFRLTNSMGLVFIYGLMLFTWKQIKTFQIQTCLTIILTLLVTSQVVSPQYLIWPFFLIPMMSPSELKTRFWKINLILICLSLLLTQYVYPLNYDTFIFDFFGQGRNVQLFWAIAARNVLLVILTVRLVLQVYPLKFLPRQIHRVNKN